MVCLKVTAAVVKPGISSHRMCYRKSVQGSYGNEYGELHHLQYFFVITVSMSSKYMAI